MLQALFMLAIVIAFMPAFINKLSSAKINQENSAVVSQINTAWAAAHLFIESNLNDLKDGVITISGDDFIDKLEPYGLPLGFIPKTALNSPISLIISKDESNIFAAITIPAKNLSEFRKSIILRSIGFWAVILDDNNIPIGATGGFEIKNMPNNLILNKNDIYVRVPENEDFSDLVSKNSKTPNVFNTNLSMDNNDIEDVGVMNANVGDVKNVSTNDFFLTGIEVDRKNKNNIGQIKAGKVIFSTLSGNALTITRSDLKSDTFSSSTISNYGDFGSITAKNITSTDFNMTAGMTGFTGPSVWRIEKNANFTNITLNVEKLSISSFLDTSRGQDVFLDATGTDVQYTYGSGIKADLIKSDSIVLRDQISSELLAGGTGNIILEIRPAGTSNMPDILIDSIDNAGLKIPITIDNTGKLETCRTIISRFGGTYNANSLSDNIICQFVMLNRIERRIDIKTCLLNGGTNCEN